MSELREVGEKTLMIFISNIIGRILLLVSVIFIGRVLGAEVFGAVSYVTSFLMFFTIVPKLGLENGIVSFLSRETIDKEEKKSLLSYSIGVTIVLSLFVVTLSYLFRQTIVDNILNGVQYTSIFLAVIPLIFLDSVKDLLKSALKGIREVKRLTLIENIFNPLSKIFLVMMVTFLFGVRGSIGLILTLYINSLTIIFFSFKELKKHHLVGRIDWSYNNNQIIRYSIPLLFAGIVTVLTHNIDSYMIGYFLDAKSVGIYKIAIQFGTISTIALTSLNMIFAPVISSMFHNKRIKELDRIFTLTTKWITIVNLFIFGFILVFPEEILMVSGEEFRSGAMTLIIVSVGQVINALTGSVGYMNVMTGQQKANLISDLIAMVGNVLLNILLIRDFGINGAAIATAVSLGIRNILKFFFMYRFLKINPYDMSYIKMMAGLILSVLVTMLAKNILPEYYLFELVIGGCLYLVVFTTVMYIFILSKKEINMLKNEIINRIR